MTTTLKEIHISNEKKRDANVRFVSLIKENDPKLAYKGKSIKNSSCVALFTSLNIHSFFKCFNGPSRLLTIILSLSL